jgi:hypothetical protein
MRRKATGVRYLLKWPRYQYSIIRDPVELRRIATVWRRGHQQPIFRDLTESRRVATVWQHGHRGSKWPEGGVFAQKARTPRDYYNPTDFMHQILPAVQQAAAVGTEGAALAFVNRWGRLGVGIPGASDADWDGVALTHYWLGRVRKWIEGYAALSKGKAAAASWPTLADFLNSAEMLAEVHHEAVATEHRLEARFRLHTLLSAVAIGLWDMAVAGGRRMRCCPECRALFIPSRADMEYCTRLCANRPTVRRSKKKRRQEERRRQREEGRPVTRGDS